MQKIYGEFLGGRAAWGLLFLRVVFGLAMMFHGWSKIQNPFGWMNRGGKPSEIPGFLQALAALAEFGGGAALVIGMLTPLACLGIVFTMIGAKFIALGGTPWISNTPGGRSWEMASLFFTAALALLFTGPGRFSNDAILFESTRRVSGERQARFRRGGLKSG